jgi:hypothetical protein
MRYRKKPVEIKAVRLVPENDQEMLRFMQETGCPFEVIGEPGIPDGPYMVVHTLEGDMIANKGDWLIQGVEGEFYPVKASVFDATYEPVG